MKKTIPFSKEITFQTKIREITDIEVTHNLEATEFNTIEGSFLVNGKYKLSDMTDLEEKFHYDLPFTIEVDEKYDLSQVQIRINDFYFEIINEDILKVNVELELSGVEEKQKKEEEEALLARCYDDEDDKVEQMEELEEVEPIVNFNKELEKDTMIIEPIDILDKVLPEKLETVNQEVVKMNVQPKSITSMFPTLSEQEDTFQSYYVYIVRDNDTLDEILTKYKTTKEELSEYNNLEEIKIGAKLIIPSSKLANE